MTTEFHCPKCGAKRQVTYESGWFTPEFAASALICDRCADKLEGKERQEQAEAKTKWQKWSEELYRAKSGKARLPHPND